MYMVQFRSQIIAPLARDASLFEDTPPERCRTRQSARREPSELGKDELGSLEFEPRRQRNFWSSTVVEARTFSHVLMVHKASATAELLEFHCRRGGIDAYRHGE